MMDDGTPQPETIYIPANPSSNDPLAIHSYLGVKFGVSYLGVKFGVIVTIKKGDDPEEAIAQKVAGLEGRVATALRERLAAEVAKLAE